jgi:2-keto-4-pentenoate hydratase/2-oxohepta-3-ene-1,7-dioic acid hydratase in catechol pathway
MLNIMCNSIMLNSWLLALIEMKEPVLFMKPTSSYLSSGGTIEIPHPLESLHHEVELAVVIGKKTRDVSAAAAMDNVGGIPSSNPLVYS